MSIKITAHLRPDENFTNVRCRAIAEGLMGLDRVSVRYMGRNERLQDADLIIQTGFASTVALRDAIQRGIPYIIMEEPHWRPDKDFCISTASWGYNGLTGGAWHPPTPEQERNKPPLLPRKEAGDTIIFAQKPNDHSIRGADHVQWVQQKLIQYPEASLRHHPLMCSGRQEPFADAIARCLHAITYTSTAGAEALIAGCVSEPEHWGSTAYAVVNRTQWLHDLSWQQFKHTEYRTRDVASWIMSGYDEARERAERREAEIPRDKLDRNVDCLRYYQEFGNAAN